MVFVIPWLGTQQGVLKRCSLGRLLSQSQKPRFNMGQVRTLGPGLKDTSLFVCTIFSPSVPFSVIHSLRMQPQYEGPDESSGKGLATRHLSAISVTLLAFHIVFD